MTGDVPVITNKIMSKQSKYYHFYIHLFMLLACIFSSCTRSKPRLAELPKKYEDIKVDNTNISLFYDLDSLAEKFTLIPLETRKESLIGEVSKLVRYKDLIIVLDKRISKNLFIFKQSGKFVGKIAEKDLEGGNISDVALRNDTIFVLSKSRVPELGFYDLQGKKMGAYKFSNLHPSNFCLTRDGLLTYSNFTANNEGYLYRVLSSSYKGKKLDRFGVLPYTSSQVRFVTLALQNNIQTGTDQLLLHEFANDTLYTLDAKSGRPKDSSYRIDFKHGAMEDKLRDSNFLKDATTYVVDRKIPTLYDMVWQSGKLIYFNYIYGEKEGFVLWNTKSKKQVFNSSAILSLKHGVQIPTVWFGTDRDNEVLSYYNASNIYSGKGSLERFQKLSSALDNYTPKDNPVICLIELKNE